MKTRGDSQLSSLNQRITMVSFTKTCSERIDEREREWRKRIMMMEGHLAFESRNLNLKFQFDEDEEGKKQLQKLRDAFT